MISKLIITLLFLLNINRGQSQRFINAKWASLYPQESETREVKSLNGLWNFRLSPPDNQYGFKQHWFKKDLPTSGPVDLMPVPSSYNDIFPNSTYRDHAGNVWYDRKFFIPISWKQPDNKVWLRFGSVYYSALVYIKGDLVMQHDIGHLPFETEITDFVKYGIENRVTVICDNSLTNTTIPQGSVTSGRLSYTFDFFNYAGIHRPVYIYTTPSIYIDDISIETGIKDTTGLVQFNVTLGGSPTNEDVLCAVEIFDKNDQKVANVEGFKGVLKIPNAKFWWPYLMHENSGYLYTLKITLSSNSKKPLDVYRLKVGIRTLEWNNSTLLINGVEAYLKGFGRHEDSDIRGKGLDLPTVIRDYSLIKWVGANTYRTSHYPYAEELYDLADREGIMIIDECPSVNTEGFSKSLLQNHMKSLTKLIKRDKNRPSVIMWSIANEPRTKQNGSEQYFKAVADHVRTLDKTRPITLAASVSDPFKDSVGKHLDIISFNRYNSWYVNTSRLDSITDEVVQEAINWHKLNNKPILMSEYGAESVSGLHKSPSVMFTEEYQLDVMSQHFKAFDTLREMGFFIGEFIWNFADFQTDQGTTRVDGNKKGIFTRQRQPKASAHHLRRRYHLLSLELNGVTPPKDIDLYTVSSRNSGHSEL